MHIHGFCKLTLLGVLALALAGCETNRHRLDFDTSAAVNIRVDNHINPDLDDRSSPIVLRVFKLADARQFEREDFLNLYENPAERLGKDLLGLLVLKELVPGEHRTEHLELTPDVHYLGFLAEYMQHDRATAMLVIPMQTHRKNTVNLEVSYLSLVDNDNPDSARNTRLAPRDQYHTGSPAEADTGLQSDDPSSDSGWKGYRGTQRTVENVQRERDFWQRATTN